jgi:hypothetical protein
LLDQSPDFGGGAGPTAPPTMRPRQPRPKLPKPFALPSDDRVWLDVYQRPPPVKPQAAECNPKYAVKSYQHWTLPVPLICGQLESKSRVLDGNDLMAAQ